METNTNDIDDLHEALVRQSKMFFLENEIINADPVVNDLILMGFMVSRWVRDVEIYIDQSQKTVHYFLFVGKIKKHLINKSKVLDKLTNMVTSGLKNYKVIVDFV